MTQQLSTHGIGASEIAAIAGLNPYASPWDVWLRKTGQAEEFTGNKFTEWGHRLEPAIRQAYSDETGATIYVPSESLFHKEVTWARATPDGIVLDGERWDRLLQCKNVGTWVEKAWSDAPPVYVQLQEQWEMWITGLARADVAVLIGGSEFRYYTVPRDDAMISNLVTIAEDFWRRVETRTPPEIDDSDACAGHFEKRFAKADAIELPADGYLETLIEEWHHLHQQTKDIKVRTETIRNHLRRAMADAGADRIASSRGTVRLQRSGGAPSTNWALVAQLQGTKHPDEFHELVAANTQPTEESLTLYAPRNWAKEAV